MSEDAERFRRHAADCRKLAANARDADDRRLLNEIATDLEAEADNIDAVDAKPKGA